MSSITERTPQHPPQIKALPDHIPRPFWSVMIPTYNCSQYLIENILSVLDQDPGPERMQIEVVDDCSTDTDVQSLVKEIGRGRVGYFRQQKNVGSLRNFETCINRSSGQYIHLLHGDDRVQNGFYAEIEKLFVRFPEAGAAFTGFTFIDEQNQRLYDNDGLLREPGLLENWLIQIASSQLIQAPAMVVKRSVYEKLGGFYAVHYGEDWEMWVRIAAHYPVAHSPRRLAFYRVHQNNITSRFFLTGQSITDAITVVNLMQVHLPPGQRIKAKRAANKHLAHYFARTADKIYHQHGEPYVALGQSKRALGMHVSPITFLYYAKMQIKIWIGYKMNRDRKRMYKPV